MTPVENGDEAPQTPAKPAPPIQGEPKNEAPFTRKIVTKPPVFKNKTPPKPVPVDKGVLAAHWAMLAFENLRGRLTYTENAERALLFDVVKGMIQKKWTDVQIMAYLVAHPPDADCSQFVATWNMAAGFPKYNDHDYTGSELLEGILIEDRAKWLIGDDVVFGPGTGVHTGKLVAPAGTDWFVVDFGEQGAPDHGLLSGLEEWFVNNGDSGMRVLRPA